MTETLPQLRTVTLLAAAYLAVSVLAVVVVVLLRDDPAQVTDVVWGRSIAVAVTAVLTLLVARSAARGSAGAYRRLRVITVVVLLAIAVFVVLPGALPVWMRVEQGVCGVLIAATVVLLNGAPVRAAFARR